MSETKEFDLGDVLSLTTGILVAPRGMEGVYDIASFLAGESLFTHQLVRAFKVFGPELLRQHPQLGAVDASGVDHETALDWLASQERIYGKRLTVTRPAAGLWEHVHPMAELREMVGPEKPILAIGPDGEN